MLEDGVPRPWRSGMPASRPRPRAGSARRPSARSCAVACAQPTARLARARWLGHGVDDASPRKPSGSPRADEWTMSSRDPPRPPRARGCRRISSPWEPVHPRRAYRRHRPHPAHALSANLVQSEPGGSDTIRASARRRSDAVSTVPRVRRCTRWTDRCRSVTLGEPSGRRLVPLIGTAGEPGGTKRSGPENIGNARHEHPERHARISMTAGSWPAFI